uniref:Uncharacterized protein n=1 Tax=Percolomonas cosmopolitus TaxID=63605 RepID=A0A7S1PG30_9EUKA
MYSSLVETLRQSVLDQLTTTTTHSDSTLSIEYNILLISCRLNINLIFYKQKNWERHLLDSRELMHGDLSLNGKQMIKILMRKIDSERQMREIEEKDAYCTKESAQGEQTTDSLDYDAEELFFDLRNLHQLIKDERLSLEKSIPKAWRDDKLRLQREWVEEHSCVRAFLAQIASCDAEAGLEHDATTKNAIDERLVALLNKRRNDNFEFENDANRGFIECFDIEDQSTTGIASRLVDWVWTWYRSAGGDNNHEDEDKLNVLQATGLMRDINLLLGVGEEDVPVEDMMKHTEEIVDLAGYLSRELVHI